MLKSSFLRIYAINYSMSCLPMGRLHPLSQSVAATAYILTTFLPPLGSPSDPQTHKDREGLVAEMSI
jgi:hypothetical protein